MNKKQVVELFKFIKSVYSQFEVDQYKIDTWSQLLEDQNPATVMRKAEYHAKTNHFPPSVADLREQVTGRYIPDTWENDMTAGED